MINPGLVKYIRITDLKVQSFNDTRMCKKAGFLSRPPVLIIALLVFAVIFMHEWLFASSQTHYWLPVFLGEELSRNELGPNLYQVRNKTTFYSYTQTKYSDLSSFSYPEQFNWLNITLQQRRN